MGRKRTMGSWGCVPGFPSAPRCPCAESGNNLVGLWRSRGPARDSERPMTFPNIPLAMTRNRYRKTHKFPESPSSQI